MSLIQCPECGQQISDKAEKCPHCGLPSSYFNQDNSTSKTDNVDYSNISNILMAAAVAKHIRALVEAGDMERAAAFLGRPYALTGAVRHGKHLGTEALFPTVNLRPEPRHVLPRFGVYATRVCLPDGRVCPGVTNVGVRPTIVDDDSVTVETNLIDFAGDLYGAELRVELLRYLRPERKFADIAALHAQIERDIAAARGPFIK